MVYNSVRGKIAMHLVRDWGHFPHQSPRVYMAVMAVYLGEVIMCVHDVGEYNSVSCVCDT